MRSPGRAVPDRSVRLAAQLRAGKPGALEHAFRDCFDERLELRIPEAYPEGAQVFRGRDGLMRWVASTKEVWDEWRFEPERFLDAGDQVAVLARVVARGGSSGVSLDRETGHLWTLGDGRVTRCEVLPGSLRGSRSSGAGGRHAAVCEVASSRSSTAERSANASNHFDVFSRM